MTEATLYMIIGFIFAVIGYLRDSFSTNYEEDKKKTKELLESLLININLTQLRLLTFALNILMWPVCLFIMIHDEITGNKDDN